MSQPLCHVNVGNALFLMNREEAGEFAKRAIRVAEAMILAAEKLGNLTDEDFEMSFGDNWDENMTEAQMLVFNARENVDRAHYLMRQFDPDAGVAGSLWRDFTINARIKAQAQILAEVVDNAAGGKAHGGSKARRI